MYLLDYHKWLEQQRQMDKEKIKGGHRMAQSATLEIEIPKGNLWTVSSIKKSMEKNGIKCNVTSCLNHLEISKNLRKQLIKPENVKKVK